MQSNLISLNNASVEFISSVDLARDLGMEHFNLMRTIKRIKERCPDLTRISIDASEYVSKRGNLPCYKIDRDGLMIIIYNLDTPEARKAATEILAKLIDISAQTIQKLAKANEQLTKLTQKRLTKQDLIQTDYGYRAPKLKIPLPEKTILVQNYEEKTYERVKIVELSPLEVALAMQNHAELVAVGREANRRKLNKFVDAMRKHSRYGGVGHSPTPKEFGIHSEYQGYFAAKAD